MVGLKGYSCFRAQVGLLVVVRRTYAGMEPWAVSHEANTLIPILSLWFSLNLRL